RLQELYGPEDLPTLSKTAISETLNGHRKALPDSAWLTCLILCCQRLAFESGALREDPGRSSLPYWQGRLRNAENLSHALGLPLRRGVRTIDDASVAQTPDDQVEPTVMFGTATDPSRLSRSTDLAGPIELTDEDHRHLADYGPYGLGLHER